MQQKQLQRTVPAKYHSRPDVAEGDIETAIEFALERTAANLDRFSGAFPAGSSVDGQYERTDGMYLWTPSFWTGLLWLASDLGDDVRFRSTATSHLEHYKRRLINGRTNHDIGFLYSLSAVAQYELTGDQVARAVGIQAAAALADRYLEAPEIIQAWGDTDAPDDDWNHGRMIVDTMMNLPLLFWASEETGDPRFREIATSHADQTASHLVREDYSTFHTYAMDVATGEPLVGETAQGHADDSAWARGQAWAIYGFALAYRYTGAQRFLETSVNVADYYLHQLPSDHVPYWDLDLSGPDVERDSSAGAIAACGLSELSTLLSAASPRRQQYENAALATVDTLAAEYTAQGDGDGILDHGVHNKPSGDGIDESTLWGDYFYVEALARVGHGGPVFW